jgi:hypothetical protein
MKYLRYILIIGLVTSVFSCKKDSHYPEVENSANAQFKRTAATGAVATPYNTLTVSKAAPATPDEFILNIVESGNVKSVSVVVDYRKSTANSVTVFTQPFATITSWPQTYTTNLSAIVALFAANGLTVSGLAVGDRFVFRVVITLNSGTIVSGQAAVLNTAPYAITLNYIVGA